MRSPVLLVLELAQDFLKEATFGGQLTNQAFGLGDVSTVGVGMAVARKGAVGIAGVLLTLRADHIEMELMLARHLGDGGARFNLTEHVQLEFFVNCRRSMVMPVGRCRAYHLNYLSHVRGSFQFRRSTLVQSCSEATLRERFGNAAYAMLLHDWYVHTLCTLSDAVGA
jgi:hypothetical protein